MKEEGELAQGCIILDERDRPALSILIDQGQARIVRVLKSLNRDRAGELEREARGVR